MHRLGQDCWRMHIAARAVFLPRGVDLILAGRRGTRAPVKRFSESDFDSCDASRSEAATAAFAAGRAAQIVHVRVQVLKFVFKLMSESAKDATD
jgi:hypothetical protein